MDDRGANIDILFRNGLKDYEVLPPPEVWNNIRPAVRKSLTPVIILRAAAMVAVVISLSFLAVKWSSTVSTGLIKINAIPPGNEESGYTAESEPVRGLIAEVRQAPVRSKTTGISMPLTNSEVTPGLSDKDNTENTEFPVINGGLSYNKSSLENKSNLIFTDDTRSYQTNLNLPITQNIPEIQTRPKSDRWTIAALASPTYFANIHSGNDQLSHELMSDEKPQISYAGGLALSYKVSKRFSVQSGLYYSSFGNELSGISSFGGYQKFAYAKGGRNFEVLTSNGVVYTNNADIYLMDNISSNRVISTTGNDSFDPEKANLEYLDNSLLQKFSYLELPVILRYKLIDRAIDFNIIGGLSSNLLVNNSVYTTVNGGKYEVGKTEGLNQITFSSSFGMGMEYNFTKNLSLNLEPTFKYYLNPYSGSSGIKVHPYTFGIFSGLSFKF